MTSRYRGVGRAGCRLVSGGGALGAVSGCRLGDEVAISCAAVGRGGNPVRRGGTKWQSRATRWDEVAIPCDAVGRGGTHVQETHPKPHKTATSPQRTHPNRTPLPPRGRSGNPVHPGGTKWHSRAKNPPKTAQNCHLTPETPPQPHTTATSGPKWQPRAPRRDEVALTCKKPTQNRTKLPPRPREPAPTAHHCHLKPEAATPRRAASEIQCWPGLNRIMTTPRTSRTLRHGAFPETSHPPFTPPTELGSWAAESTTPPLRHPPHP